MILSEGVKKFLRFYLDRFNVNLTSARHREIEESLTKERKLESFYIRDTKVKMLEFGRVFLVRGGMKRWRLVTTHEIVDFYLKKEDSVDDDTPSTFYNFQEEILFIWHMKRTMENRRLEELVSHVIAFRATEGKITVVMAETDIPQVRSTCEENNIRVISSVSTMKGAEEI